ncbi:MAG: DUF1800 domain-containing protein [Candidatus Sulfopaludibacter sp.]|nr:DUF1800 domain-containing protein [Candidatus Sulfopaludibacter sp.]
MTRLVIVTTILTVVPANAQNSFDIKLPAEQRSVHALNRLTFGPRPGDVEAVRRIGIEKWIAIQLHPESLPEDSVLEQRLRQLDTLGLDTATILKDYPVTTMRPMQRPQPTEIVTQEQFSALLRGREEDQLAVLNKLDATKRRQILTYLPPQNFAYSPELKKEAEAARMAEQEERQQELRKMNPPLQDLLSPEQARMATGGTPEQRQELFASLDPAKLQQVASAMAPASLAGFPELRRQGMMKRFPQQLAFSDLKEGRIYRAVYSSRQLQEVLVDFWLNHFNVFEGKMNVRPLLPSFERDAIRPHVLGRFKDLLLATARHPAMLYYLDNFESTAPEIFSIGPFADPVGFTVQGLSRRAHGINENYGRELMELHTLGVKGGYTQQDVIAVARCFTGWTVRQPASDPTFVFAAFMHDTGEKVVLGHKIAAGGGEQDGLQVIDILAHHPATAKLISRELAQRFVADDPPPSLVDRMAQVFTKTDGDLRAVMAAMFAAPEFFSQGARLAKVKSPLEMVVSSVRTSGAEVTDPWMLVQRIADLGEPLYGKVEPTGYPNTAEAWLSTANLLGRISFASELMAGKLAGVKVDPVRFEGQNQLAIARELLEAEPSPAVRDAMETGFEGKDPAPLSIAAVVMGSPDFQKR